MLSDRQDAGPISEGNGNQICLLARFYMVIKAGGTNDFGPKKKLYTVSIRSYHLISNIGASHYDGACNFRVQLTLEEPYSWLLT
jgi:hypothetical protein